MADGDSARGVRSMRNFLTRKKSTSDPNINGNKHNGAQGDREMQEGGAKQNGEMGLALLSPRSQTPPVERKNKFSIGRFFKPWKWKRKKKSDKFAETQRSLERKISVRANRDDLIQKGILLPDSPTSAAAATGPLATEAPDLLKERDLAKQAAEKPSPLVQHQPIPAPAPTPTPAPAPARLPAAGEPPPPERPASLVPLEVPPDPRLSLSRLPEPPIAVTEVGPIPPPPMFCNGPRPAASSVTTAAPLDLSDPRYDDLEEEEVMFGDYDDEDDEYYPMSAGAGSGRCEEVAPVKEPRPDLQPLKSALKKKPRPPPPVRGDLASAEDSDDSDGPILYRDDEESGPEPESGVLTRLGSRVQRSDSLALKLAQRPARQELIDRNIIHVQTEQDRSDWRSELSAKLNRRLSLRPTAEELEERNILKKMTAEESQRDMENKKATLLRKLSFRPTIEELKRRKVIQFNEYVDVTEAHEYDRRADKPWTRLTPRDKAMIRKELNDFKASEMDVHEESRHLTRFHRP